MNNIYAALIFFTRLPFWRLVTVPKESYKNVVAYWPAVGWLTGGISCLVLWLGSMALPFHVAVILMFLVRVIITGALHDDGLADFCDGFGGGVTRERILVIMKDSHIGTYGVIGLVFYYITAIGLVASLPLHLAMATVFAGDAWSKFCAGRLIDFLPYARKEEEAKSKVVYNRLKPGTWIASFLLGALPLLLLHHGWEPVALFFPVAMISLLIWIMKRRIQGYTGDCCGAAFLICELSFFLGMAIINHLEICRLY